MQNMMKLAVGSMTVFALVACAGSDGTDGTDGVDGTQGNMGTMGTMGTAGVGGFKTAAATNIVIPANATAAPAFFIDLPYTPPTSGFAVVTLSGQCIVRHTNSTNFDDLVVSIYDADNAGETGDLPVVFESGSRIMLPPGEGGLAGSNYFFPISGQRIIDVTQGTTKMFRAGEQWVGNTSNQNANCSGRLVLTHHLVQLP